MTCIEAGVGAVIFIQFVSSYNEFRDQSHLRDVVNMSSVAASGATFAALWKLNIKPHTDCIRLTLIITSVVKLLCWNPSKFTGNILLACVYLWFAAFKTRCYNVHLACLQPNFIYFVIMAQICVAIHSHNQK